MFLLDMTCKVCEMIAVKMDQSAAAQALQMEMTAALLLVLNVLIAGTGLAVKGVFPHQSLLHQTVELSVYGGDSHGSSLSRQKGAYLLDIGVLVLVVHKI